MALSCFNCQQDAVWHITDPGASDVHYCRRCLPNHLARRADAGHFGHSNPAEVVEAALDAAAVDRAAGRKPKA